MPLTIRRPWGVLLGSLMLLHGTWAAADTPELYGTAARRRPVAAVLTNDGRTLCVANQVSGTLSRIDLATSRVVGEQTVGERLSDLARLERGDGDLLLVSDEAAHELLVVGRRGGRFEVRQRVAVPRHPASIAASSDGATIAVAGLWSRRVMLLTMCGSSSVTDAASDSEISDLKSRISNDSSFSIVGVDGDSEISVFRDQSDGEPALAATSRVRLSFSPRRMLLLDGARRLLVLDAFGGQVALIDVAAASGAAAGSESTFVQERTLPAQNIRGARLSADGTRVLLTQQVLSPLTRADYDDIHWGNLLQNAIREIPVATVLDPQADLVSGSRVVPLGAVGRGAADPAGLTLLPALDGRLTCLAGTGEVMVETRYGSGRVEVGAQPVAAVWDPQRGVVYVVCRLDDVIAVVDPVSLQVRKRIPLGPRPASTPADRGERLFVDGRLSHDGWLSCASCHPGGHTTGGLADTFSDDSYGTPKRILSLLGTRDSNPWAWNGQFRGLHDQVASSFESSLQGERLPAAQVADVVAYLHLLRPPPPVEEGEWTDEQQTQIAAGRQVFKRQRCGRCHVPPHTFTIDLMFDVGLDDEAGLRKFNPPSLRGVGHRQRLFHDGRAASLNEVFSEYGHQIDEPLAEDELAALVMYLRSL